MPELPEVEVVVKSLKHTILNKKIKKVLIFKEKIIKEIDYLQFSKSLENQTILNLTRKSKFIVFHLTKNIILSHLRMEGKYTFYNSKVPIKKHHHIIFEFTDNSELHYSDTRLFGTFHLREKQTYLDILPLSKLAEEPKNIDPTTLHNKLSKKRIAIKTSLLNQEIISGLGNIYVDETLFACKINPTTPSNAITKKQVIQIINEAKKIFEIAIKNGGTTISTFTASIGINGQHIDGRFQSKLKVHLQKDKPCKVCKNKIKKIKINGRGTYFCMECQK